MRSGSSPLRISELARSFKLGYLAPFVGLVDEASVSPTTRSWDRALYKQPLLPSSILYFFSLQPPGSQMVERTPWQSIRMGFLPAVTSYSKEHHSPLKDQTWCSLPCAIHGAISCNLGSPLFKLLLLELSMTRDGSNNAYITNWQPRGSSLLNPNTRWMCSKYYQV